MIKYNKVSKTIYINKLRITGTSDAADFTFYGNIKPSMLRGVVRDLIICGASLSNVQGDEAVLRQNVKDSNFVISSHVVHKHLYEMDTETFLQHANKIK